MLKSASMPPIAMVSRLTFRFNATTNRLMVAVPRNTQESSLATVAMTPDSQSAQLEDGSDSFGAAYTFQRRHIQEDSAPSVQECGSATLPTQAIGGYVFIGLVAGAFSSTFIILVLYTLCTRCSKYPRRRSSMEEGEIEIASILHTQYARTPWPNQPLNFH